jgi:6-phosphogluconolactonase
MLNFRVFESTAELAAAAASELVWLTEHRDGCVIALSGGSTPRPLYELLGGGEWRARLEQCEVVWVTGDERCVPPDHPDSNALMIEQTLFRSGIPKGHHFIRFRTESGDAPAVAEQFEREWKKVGIDGLDLAVLGMGEDGHTASLFPGTDILDVEDRVAAPVFVPRLEAWRVSLTVPVLRQASGKMVLVSGAGKRGVIEEVSRGSAHPIALVAGGAEAWWFVDREAYPG